MKRQSFALMGAILMAVATCPAAINWNSPTFSIALTKAEIETVAGISSPDGFCSASFVKSTTGTLLLIQDPSGTNGTGLVEIDLSTKTGLVRATDAAINAACDENVPPADADCTGLALDTRDGSVYMLDREETDQIIKIAPNGTITNLAGITAATIGNSGVAFAQTGLVTPAYGLVYCNQDTDAVLKYDLATNTESVLVPLANWTAVTGGTQNGFAAGPVVNAMGRVLIFDELSFSGSDNIVSVDPQTGVVSISTPASVFGSEGPGFSTMVVTSDGTIVAWDEFATTPCFTIVPAGTGTPIRIARSVIAAALGKLEADVDPSDENSMMVLVDTPTQVEILFGISGTGDIGKITFGEGPTAAADWQVLE